MKNRCLAKLGARVLGGAIALAVFFLASSCSDAGISSFKWKDSSGETIALSQTGNFPKGEENLFSQARLKNSFSLRKTLKVEPGFMIAASVKVKETGLIVGIALSPEARKGGQQVRFAAKAGHTTFYLSLPESRSVKTLTIGIEDTKGSPSAKDETTLVELEGISVLPAFSGFEHAEDGSYRISDGISTELSASGSSLWTFHEPFVSSLAYAASVQGRERKAPVSALVIKYSSNANADIQISAGNKIFVKCESALKGLLIPASVFPEASGLGRMEVSVPRAIGLEALYIEAVPAEKASTVDPGVLLLGQTLSPDEDFAWYRWDMLPHVIMFDFRNYAVQDAYLKRLAFFVEKKGFVGRLAKDEEIATLHGWNAHDYKTDDLARFFSAAEKTGFRLNPEELRLRDFLLEQKLLERRGKEYGGLDGAIISISQESPPYLRHTFLTHESSHGLFFADKRYRDFCISLWNGLSKEEKWYWILYFGWMNYDTSSAYLMANEMQAYLIQQPPQKAEEYFTKTIPERLLEHHPELESPLALYMDSFGPEFGKKAKIMDDWLKARYGFGAGTTFFLR